MINHTVTFGTCGYNIRIETVETQKKPFEKEP
jgi:hypothetical protein